MGWPDLKGKVLFEKSALLGDHDRDEPVFPASTEQPLPSRSQRKFQQGSASVPDLLIRAIVQGLLTEIMLRFFFGFVGLCLLAAAFVTLTVDVTRSVTSGTLYVTSIGEGFMVVLPSKFVVARDFVERHVYPVIWDPVLADILRLPVWLALGVVGTLTLWLGGKPAPKFGFSSR